MTEWPRVVRAVEEIATRLEGASVDWLISGSVALALQGVELDCVDDVDVEAAAEGAYAVQARLADRVVRPVEFSCAGNVRSHFGVLDLDGVRVEVIGGMQIRDRAGGWSPPYAAGAGKVQVRLGERRLPVLSLAAALEQYRRLERPERVALLSRLLA